MINIHLDMIENACIEFTKLSEVINHIDVHLSCHKQVLSILLLSSDYMEFICLGLLLLISYVFILMSLALTSPCQVSHLLRICQSFSRFFGHLWTQIALRFTCVLIATPNQAI